MKPPSLAANGIAAGGGWRVEPDIEVWRRSLLRVALPSAGCFVATYPAGVWTRVACSKPPNIMFPPPPGKAVLNSYIQPQAFNVGDGNDYMLLTGSDLISTATGSFPVVTGVTSVKSTGGNPGCGSYCGANSYSLQLNSNVFPSTACNGQSDCAGWEQFLFFNPPNADSQLFIEDWLLPTGSQAIQCPAGEGWMANSGGCYQNSQSLAFDNYGIKDWLGKFEITGSADSSGDSIFLGIDGTEYGYKNIQGDGITDLSSNWNGGEFNVVGDGGRSEAVFNSGASVTVSLEVDDGVLTAPTCANEGTTGETNNLNLVSPPPTATSLQYPSILFTESNVAGGTAGCDVATGTGIPPTPAPTALPTIPILK